jgi:hypothetical protein
MSTSTTRKRALADDSTERSNTERSSTERSNTERSNTERSSTERSNTERSNTERSNTERSNTERSNKKKRLSTKGVSFYIPLNLHINNETSVPVVEETTFTQTEVTALLAKQEHYFRQLLEEKLKEQFNMFNQLYIENIFKEYSRLECPYIN